MSRQRNNAKSSGYRKGKLDLRESYRPNPGGFWSKLESERKCESFGDFWESLDEIATVIKKVARNEGAVNISVHGRDLDVFFGKKAQNDAPAAESRVESTERLDSLKQAFENEDLESKVPKTWTPTNPSARKRNWERFNRRLCDNMEKELENLQKVKLLEKSEEDKISSAVEAVESSGEGDEGPCDDVKSCAVKASLSVDLTSASVETPSLNCCMEKTETKKPLGEGDEDQYDDGSNSNDERLESESEL